MSDPTSDHPTPQDSANRRVVRNSLYMFGQHFFVALATIFIAALIARHLGKTNYGIYAYAFSWVKIFIIISAFGLRPVTVRAIAQNRSLLAETIGKTLTLRFILACVSFVILLVISSLLHDEPVVLAAIAIAAGMLLLNSISTPLRDAFQGLERLEVEAITAIGVRLFTLVGALLAIWFDKGVLVITLIYMLGAGVGVIIPLLAARREKIPLRLGITAKETRTELRNALPFAGTAFIGIFMSKINPVLIGMLSTHAMVGVFAAGQQLVMSLAVIPDAIATSLFPTIARGWKDESIQIAPLLQQAFFYILMFALPVSVGGILCSPAIINLIFGDAFRESSVILQILLIAMPLQFITLPSMYVLGAIYRQRAVAIVITIAAIVNVTANVILIPDHGAIGSAYAELTRTLVAFFGIQIVLALRYRIWSNPTRYVRLALAVSVLAIVVFPLRSLTPLLSVPLGAIAYIISVFAFRVMTWDQARSFARQAIGRKTKG